MTPCAPLSDGHSPACARCWGLHRNRRSTVGSPESGARHDERLDRYWDEVVLGLPGAETGLDPADVAAIHRLRRDVHLPGISATFRRQLRRDLMRTPSLPVSSGPRAFSLDGAWLPERGLER